MLVVNKQVVSILRLPLTMLWIQMAAATLVLAPYVWLHGALKPLPDALRWARVVPPLFATTLATGMLALKFASLGAVIVVRNATPLLSLLLEAAVLRERSPASAWTWASLVGVLVGAALYIDEDLNCGTTVPGVVFLVLNMAAVTAERMTQRQLLVVRPVRLATPDLLLLNNGLGAILVTMAIPLAPIGPYKRPEAHSFSFLDPDDYSTVQTAQAYVLLAVSCACGLAIGWAGLRVQSHLSATSMLVLTNLNKVVVVAAGVMFFGETRTERGLLGMAVVLLGGAAYGALQCADLAARGPMWQKAGQAVLALSAALLVIVVRDAGKRRATNGAVVVRPAMPQVEFLSVLDPTEADVRRVPGGATLSVMPSGSMDGQVHGANGRKSTVWGTMVLNPRDGFYHYLTRIGRDYGEKRNHWEGTGLYYARYSADGFRAQLANPTLPWHGPDSNAQLARVLANVDDPNCTKLTHIEDPRAFLLGGVPHAIASGGAHMWIAKLDPLPDGSCSTWVRLHAEPPTAEHTQKNWSPFEHQGALHVVYSWRPLVVLRCNSTTGKCARTEDVEYPSDMSLNDLRGGTQLVPTDEGQWLSFLHSRRRCAITNFHIEGTELAVMTFSEPHGFEVRYVSGQILPWTGHDDPDLFAFVNMATGIVSTNVSVDEVLMTTNEMDSVGRLARLTGAHALAQWGAAQRDVDWFPAFVDEIDAVCASQPTPPGAARLEAVAWGVLGAALTAALAVACAVGWLRAQGYVVASKGCGEHACIVAKEACDVSE